MKPGFAVAQEMQQRAQHLFVKAGTMNIVTRLAIIEQILEDGASEPTGRIIAAPSQRRIGDRRRLIDDLDRAQMLKAVAYVRPGRYTTT